jgi:uncharacterized protein (DUF2252 family)
MTETLTPPIAPAEHVDQGKSLRAHVPRQAHGEWRHAHGRENPIDILRKSDENRVAQLVPIRYGRMLPTPFTFFRGAAAVMAADLAGTPTIGVMVQACGDCHLKNFGGFATPERNIVFDINDFDETLPAPWEWDVKRLATSFVLAARTNGLPNSIAHQLAVTCAEFYRKGVRQFAKLDPLDLWYLRTTAQDFIEEIGDEDIRADIAARVQKAASRRGADIDYPKLAEVVDGETRIRDTPPLIFHPEEMRADGSAKIIQDALSEYRDSLPHERRVLFDRYHFVDAALKVVGVGSVGTRCWIALFMSSANEPLFLQIKQASQSVLEPYAGKSAYENNGQRVVVGQRLMQGASDIFLGWTRGPAGDFYVRQLRDAKISPLVENFDESMFLAFAEACGRNLARAHAKSGNASTIRGYLGKSDAFDEAIGTFADRYADQTELDHAMLKSAVRSGKVDVYVES